ncbi:MAG: tRNA (5-methylaminomethyl-2-thiouridine)(34)-methyltransferase MnmD [Cyclobacteriaceae bacterium]|nr:tRNA (5-methylaminomethyl-2-thiouridine)(34)-methyltransferase MnmD [Cyclobacteriaceae bacterium]
MLTLITTTDGSHTLRNEILQETYHSIHGAIQESMHVFIKHGLHYAIDRDQDKQMNILEVGFGTGLNSLLTAVDEKALNVNICYDTIEAFPVSLEHVRLLNYSDIVGRDKVGDLFDRLHQVSWGEVHSLKAGFTFRKIHSDLCKTQLEKSHYDIVYFDAFAPTKQPELWTLEIISLVVRSLKPRGIFVTYSAKGQLKRDLVGLGMKLEIQKGPPGKAEMTRAIKDK